MILPMLEWQMVASDTDVRFDMEGRKLAIVKHISSIPFGPLSPPEPWISAVYVGRATVTMPSGARHYQNRHKTMDDAMCECDDHLRECGYAEVPERMLAML